VIGNGFDPFSPVSLPFNILAVLSVYLLGVWLVEKKRSTYIRRAVVVGSDNAYGVYLAQMIWIPLLQRFFRQIFPAVPWVAQAIVVVALVYALGLLFSGLAARTPIAKALCGRSPIHWRSPWLKKQTDQGPFTLTATN
jgi:surface polysaccharide O-acyltransferase-like enzyme